MIKVRQQYNKNTIISILKLLHIDYDENRIHKNWMVIRCPLHPDKVMGNAGINLHSGVIYCFSCKQSVSLYKLYMSRTSSSDIDDIKKIFNFQEVTFTNEESFSDKVKKIKNYFTEDFIYVDLKPNDYFYTRQRGFSETFCKKFNIVHCISEPYIDYFLVPIIDSKKNIHTFEARKLKQRETIIKYYSHIDFNLLNQSPEEFFKNEKIKNEYKIKDNCIIDKNGNKIYSIALQYLLRTKVLYPPNSNIPSTIWNIDNLDYNKELWLSEGLGTVPKLYENITENCSALFGSNVPEEKIEYLQKFKKIIVVSDHDKASLAMIRLLNTQIDSVYVSLCELDDTDDNFIKQLQESKIVRASEYLLKNYKNFLKN